MKKKLEKFSIGIGDRFGHQGAAQLKAVMQANKQVPDICPVWNKSNREHMNVHSLPADVRTEADRAVKNLGFTGKYFVDADHINLSTVDSFVASSDFFTFDVADLIGKNSPEDEISSFVSSCSKYMGTLLIPGIEEPFIITKKLLIDIASKFLAAACQTSRIYDFLANKKGAGNFITEVSMDEVSHPQSPVELLFILKMLAGKGVPVQTIAPKFCGRFNKGVDYSGNLNRFEKEFEENMLVIDYAVKEFGLPEELKLSVHSGSDKFSIYPVINKIIKKYGKGLHLKTAGTTWLEEVTGLAVAGGKGLDFARRVYAESYNRKEELCAPYSDVIDIDNAKLPPIKEVYTWSGDKYANTLRHIETHTDYNPHFRQLIHVAYKIAAEAGNEYTGLLNEYNEIIGRCVEENIYERHLKRIFF
jgi:hypothetical protein